MKNNYFKLISLEKERIQMFEKLIKHYYFRFHNIPKSVRNIEEIRHAKDKVRKFANKRDERLKIKDTLTSYILASSEFPMITIVNIIANVLSSTQGTSYIYSIKENGSNKDIEFRPFHFGENDQPFLTLSANKFDRISFYCLNDSKDLKWKYDSIFGYLKNFFDIVINERLNSDLSLSATEQEEFLKPIAKDFITTILIADGKIPEENEGVKRN